MPRVSGELRVRLLRYDGVRPRPRATDGGNKDGAATPIWASLRGHSWRSRMCMRMCACMRAHYMRTPEAPLPSRNRPKAGRFCIAEVCCFLWHVVEVKRKKSPTFVLYPTSSVLRGTYARFPFTREVQKQNLVTFSLLASNKKGHGCTKRRQRWGSQPCTGQCAHGPASSMGELTAQVRISELSSRKTWCTKTRECVYLRVFVHQVFHSETPT